MDSSDYLFSLELENIFKTMNKDILFIFTIFILIILGVYFVFINGGLSDNPVFNNLNSLKQTTQIEFSNIKENNFVYKFENGDQLNISGMGFHALNISNESSDAISKYFEDNGFNMDYFEISGLSGISYYSKNKDACIVKTSVLIDENGLPQENSNKLNANIFCGELVN